MNGQVTLEVDGASKGNPGRAGIGVRIKSAGRLLASHSDYIGETTNNSAEYQALIRGLELAKEEGATRVSVISDSELVVNQLKGVYKVKTRSLRPLYERARALADRFEGFRIQHVGRSENQEADRLANEGILKGTTASGPDGRARQGEESPSSTGKDAG